MKEIVLGIPAFDGKIPVEFASSLLAVQREYAKEYNVTPLFIKGDSLLVRARNELFFQAHERQSDALVFIDADMLWNAEDLKTLLEAPGDVVGATYRKKVPQILFTLNIPPTASKVSKKTKLCEVNSLGTGFLRINRRAINKIWDNAPKYTDPNSKKEMASVFVTFADPVRGIVGEDTYFCDQWRALDEKVYLHTGILLGHMGNRVFQGDVIEFLKEYKMYEEVD